MDKNWLKNISYDNFADDATPDAGSTNLDELLINLQHATRSICWFESNYTQVMASPFIKGGLTSSNSAIRVWMKYFSSKRGLRLKEGNCLERVDSLL